MPNAAENTSKQNKAWFTELCLSAVQTNTDRPGVLSVSMLEVVAFGIEKLVHYMRSSKLVSLLCSLHAPVDVAAEIADVTAELAIKMSGR